MYCRSLENVSSSALILGTSLVGGNFMFTRFNFKALAALNDEVSNDENVEVDPNLSKIYNHCW